MKPTISFVLQLSQSTAYENLEAVARNVLDGIDVLLSSGVVKCSLYIDGPTIEAMRKVAKPLMFGKIKNGIREGILEFLGGGFYDPMLSFFPEELQMMQLNSHRKLLNKCFDAEPQGFYNSSLVWEMGMTAVIESAGFDYALVSEAAIQDALGRSTPVSGWFTIEDKGAFVRIVPVADALSKALENDDLNWKQIAEPYCRGGKSAVVLMDLPPEPSEIVHFFERFVDFIEMNEVQTWPVGYAVNQLHSEGSLSNLVSAGRKLGLPSTARTCREALIRRPEMNLLQKAFLSLYRRAKVSLEPKRFVSFCEKLLPVMSPIFFRDLCGGKGMQSLNVRQWGYRYLVNAARELDKITEFAGLRIEVCDFLLLGRKVLWFENKDISCLLDYYAGGIMRSIFYKPVPQNLLNSWRDDGEPCVGFLDVLLPNVDVTPEKVEQMLEGRENTLAEPFDYQIQRDEQGAEVQLLEEQGYCIGEKRGVFHVQKTFLFDNSSSEIKAVYKVMNSTYMESKCFFGTLFEFGILENSNGIGVTIDGKPVKWDKKQPFIYPEASTMDIRDYALGCSYHMKFAKPAALFIGSVFSASASAAPDVFQGIRVYPFWRMALNVMDELQANISLSVTKK
ncbi:MAG: DUF1926 domain-containing protein [Fibrobacter sp.]|nr:DUF1926 domain-containing protein [Fibrobacter sp.]